MTASDPPDFTQQVLDAESDPFLSLKRGGSEIYLIRHADALPSAQEVLAGGYDEQALSELGRRQAQALAERLREVPFAAVYCSPIARARQTAAPVAALHRLDVMVDLDLREVELGPVGPAAFTRATPEELSAILRSRLKDIAMLALEAGGWSGIPGTEPSAALRSRITSAIDRLAQAHPGARLAVVSHGGIINAYVAAILGIARDYFFPAANTSISVVRVKGQRRLLMGLNDISHLRDAGLFKVEG